MNTNANFANNPSRDALILGQLAQVELIARRMHRRLPATVSLDDLISAGTIGLIGAVDKFDESRGLKLKTYAEQRIRGAILDFLRREDPLSRTERRRVRAGERPPIRLESLDAMTAGAASMLPGANIESPFDQAVVSAARCRILAVLGRLPSTTQEVLRLRFDADMSRVSLASRLGISAAQAGRIEAQAVEQMARALR